MLEVTTALSIEVNDNLDTFTWCFSGVSVYQQTVDFM